MLSPHKPSSANTEHYSQEDYSQTTEPYSVSSIITIDSQKMVKQANQQSPELTNMGARLNTREDQFHHVI